MIEDDRDLPYSPQENFFSFHLITFVTQSAGVGGYWQGRPGQRPASLKNNRI
jgi:hypothetical protein